MFKIESEIIPHTFGEKRIKILEDDKVLFSFLPETVKSLGLYVIDPIHELTMMMINELERPDIKEEIYNLLKNNLK